jgi:DMSO/TMAO reductase YedYZ molybdopterin-dependent catalytic subunit
LKQHAKMLPIAILLVATVTAAFLVFYWQNRPRETPTPSPAPTETSVEETTKPTITPPSNTLLATSTTPPQTVTPTEISAPQPSSTLIPSPSMILSPSPSQTSSPTPTTPPLTPVPTTPIVLYPGEVRQYQGQQLDTIASVYENAIAGTQYINQTTYKLTISGLVNNPTKFSYQETLNHQRALYQKVVTIYCVEGWSATILWEGVLVKDLIQYSAPNSSANTVIFHAADGYTTALPLSYVTSNNILLAYKMNAVVIPPERGFPFMLVAESQYGYKWIKWVTEIELSNDPNYLGFWESRGYPNDATIP